MTHTTADGARACLSGEYHWFDEKLTFRPPRSVTPPNSQCRAKDGGLLVCLFEVGRDVGPGLKTLDVFPLGHQGVPYRAQTNHGEERAIRGARRSRWHHR
jgi:hypothetical protein